jgi:hypothetical protein
VVESARDDRVEKLETMEVVGDKGASDLQGRNKDTYEASGVRQQYSYDLRGCQAYIGGLSAIHTCPHLRLAHIAPLTLWNASVYPILSVAYDYVWI